jgi:hypothetical protein
MQTSDLSMMTGTKLKRIAWLLLSERFHLEPIALAMKNK